jgi:putative sterol carrier protein
MSAVPTASIEAAAEWLRKHFAPEAARGVRATYQLDLAGEGGGLLRLEIDDGVLLIAQGRAEAPQVILRAPAALWLAVLGGRENGELLYMAGRIQIDGDLGLAAKLRSFFGRRT